MLENVCVCYQKIYFIFISNRKENDRTEEFPLSMNQADIRSFAYEKDIGNANMMKRRLTVQI